MEKAFLQNVHIFPVLSRELFLQDLNEMNMFFYHVYLFIFYDVYCSDHHVYKLLQRELGHRSAKRFHGCETRCRFRGGRRRCIQDHPGTYRTFSKLFRKHDY